MMLLLMLQAMSIAQPNTGQTIYSHGSLNPQLTSGTYVSTDPGFIMAGHGMGGITYPKLVIDKVDMVGLFNSSPGEFMKQYTVTTGGVNCNVSLTLPSDCSGISIIETYQGADQYAWTAAFEEGCLISFMNNAGVPTTSKFFPFPTIQSTGLYSKPLIVESLLSPGNYYVVGSYRQNSRDYIYVIKTDVNFSSGWTTIYSVGNNVVFRPKGIIESTFGVLTGELIIVGFVDNQGNGLDGFLMAIDDASSGTVNFAKRYYSTSTFNDMFLSVQLANSNSGYIVGGYTNDTAIPGPAWMLRLFANGSVDWSKQIEFFNDNSAGEVVGVQERYNTSNAYEYYGLSTSVVGGMLVAKLQNNGSAFGGTYDESHYYYSTTAQPNSISHNNNVGDPNEGFHSFGNTNNSPNEFYLVQSCFNGPAGNGNTIQKCTNLNQVNTGASNNQNLSVHTSSGLSPCSYYNISNSNITTSPTQDVGYLNLTLPSTPYTGNNAKSYILTGSLENKKQSSFSLSVYPNPTDNKLSLNIRCETGDELLIEIQSILGQQLYQSKAAAIAELNEYQINIKELDLQPGLYIVKVIKGSQQKEVKFLIEKE